MNRERRRNMIVLLGVGTMLAVMVTMVSFSVTLYRLFCASTGFGGATQRAAGPRAPSGDRTVTVQFTTDVAPNLPWRFAPDQQKVTVHLGETAFVSFTAQNLTDQPIVGHATFNVTPDQTGLYFKKIQCFCFDEEQLDARQTVSMPVQFFVDPALAKDPETREVDTITLSYTFFRSVNPRDAKDLSRFTAAAPDAERGKALFAERCAACHALDRSKAGPKLGNLSGRRAGTVAGYPYSSALRAADITWTAETLESWLVDPRALVRGARMPVKVPDRQDRRDIIAYLLAPAKSAAATLPVKPRADSR